MTSPTHTVTPNAGLTGLANDALTRVAGNAQQIWAGQPNAFSPSQSPQTQQYIQNLTQMGQQGTPLTGAAQQGVLGILNANGMNGNTQNGLTNIAGIANGATGIRTGGQYQNFANGAADPNAIGKYLTNYANGSMVGHNAAFDQMLQNQNTQIANNVNLNASMGGRYGSGAYQGLLTNQLAQNDTAAHAQQYNQDVANQINAAGMLSGEQQNGYTDRLNALNGLTGVQGQNIANQMNASNSQIGAGQTANQQQLTAAAMAPSIYQFQQAPNQLLGQAGAIQDAFQQQQQMAPVQNLQNYAQTVGGILSPFAGQASVTKGASPLQTGLGIASTGLGVLGAL